MENPVREYAGRAVDMVSPQLDRDSAIQQYVWELQRRAHSNDPEAAHSDGDDILLAIIGLLAPSELAKTIADAYLHIDRWCA